MAAKRAIDLLVATLLLVLLAPLMLALALLVRVTMGSPVLFRQPRPGYNGRLFTIYKFRTMSDKRDDSGELLSDDQRMVPFGSLLRKTTLDSLPEMLNVLKGDMALVGPRPLLPEYLDLYTPEQMRRHEVRPGMAGPVVMGGRNAPSWEVKFRLDVWYVDNWSLWLDAKVFAGALWKVVRREGVSHQGHVTAPKFQGSSRTGEGRDQ
jgi:sugar transferase EpsL